MAGMAIWSGPGDGQNQVIFWPTELPDYFKVDIFYSEQVNSLMIFPTLQWMVLNGLVSHSLTEFTVND